jgi:5'-nucleotidase
MIMIKHRLSTAVVVGATCAALALGTIPAHAAEDFDDNPKGSQFYRPVRWMQNQGISYGYTDGSYGKYRDISRGESVAFIYRYIGPDYEADGDPFDDVTDDSTFYEEISWAAAQGIAKGYTDDEFRSSQSVTRGEFVEFIYRAKGPDFNAPDESDFPDVSTDYTHYEAISWASVRGIVTGNTDRTFRPSEPISRAEVAQIIYNGATKSW